MLTLQLKEKWIRFPFLYVSPLHPLVNIYYTKIKPSYSLSGYFYIDDVGMIMILLWARPLSVHFLCHPAFGTFFLFIMHHLKYELQVFVGAEVLPQSKEKVSPRKEIISNIFQGFY